MRFFFVSLVLLTLHTRAVVPASTLLHALNHSPFQARLLYEVLFLFVSFGLFVLRHFEKCSFSSSGILWTHNKPNALAS
jgi:hypothetical protein